MSTVVYRGLQRVQLCLYFTFFWRRYHRRPLRRSLLVWLLEIIALGRHSPVALDEISYFSVGTSPSFVHWVLFGGSNCRSGHLYVQLLVHHFLGSNCHILNLGEWLLHTVRVLNRRVLNQNGIIVCIFVPVLRKSSMKILALALVFSGNDNLGWVLNRILDAAKSRLLIISF